MHSKKYIFGFVLAGVGLALAVAGACTGGLTDVFRKAAIICLECIGIG